MKAGGRQVARHVAGQNTAEGGNDGKKTGIERQLPAGEADGGILLRHSSLGGGPRKSSQGKSQIVRRVEAFVRALFQTMPHNLFQARRNGGSGLRDFRRRVS